MGNFFTDNDDLQFQFQQGIDWSALVEVSEYGFTAPDAHKSVAEALEFYREIADTVGTLVADEFAPHTQRVDREDAHVQDGEVVEGATMKAFFDKLRELEIHKLCIPRELGGLNAPLLVYFLVGEMIARADTGAMTHFSFHGGMAMAMLVFSIQEGTTEFEPGRIRSTRFEKAIGEIARGEAWGCMDITEPDAGSDMAALRTTAVQDADGNWFVSGQKIFITSGHGKYHFVIARTETTEDPEDLNAGLAGLSMFLVPAYEDREDGTRARFVTIDRVEEKLGHHASVTAALSFERAPAMLIGKRGEGFRYMLTLMNNARLGVGFECIGLCESALRMAREYANGRRSMGKFIARHEMIADALDEMQTDVQALRALAVHAAWHEELAQKVAVAQKIVSTPTGEVARAIANAEKHRRTARRLTPLLKYLAAEKSVEHARRCVQIHGGVGYTREYSAEKLLRDAMVLPIYEGTSQIQSLMAMKDTLVNLIRRPADFLSRKARAHVRALSAADPMERALARIQSHSLDAQQHLATRTALGKLRGLSRVSLNQWKDELTKNWDPKRDFALAMLHAERLTRILADEAIAEILFEQARSHPQRRELLERWIERAEPRTRALHHEITTTGHRLLASLQASS